MAPTRDRVKSLRVALETGGFAVDPSSDGSGYTVVKTLDLGYPVDQTELLDTNYYTGRNRMTKKEVGPDGAQLEFSVPLQGLAAAVGNGSSPAADDWFDILVNHMFGDSTDVDGEDVTATAAGTISLTTDLLTAPFDLIPVWETGVHDSETQWRLASGGSSPYAVHRNWDDTPTTSAIVYGHKLWLHADAITRSTLAAYVEMDDTPYTLLGGGVTACTISMEAGQLARMNFTVNFDSKTQASKGSVAAITSGTIDANTPIQGELAEIEFNGTLYAASSVEIDFGIETAPVGSVAGSNGRSDMKAFAVNPVIRFTPQFQTGIETAFRAGTTGKALVRFGGGVVSGGVLNSIAVYCDLVQVDEAPNAQADGPLVRQQVVLRSVDPGLDGSANKRPYFAFGRA